MVPAHALAEVLLQRGHRVALITDDRGARIPGLFDNVQVHVLPAGRLAGGPVGWFRAARSIMTGRAMALRLYETFLPSAVIGFGGYPAFPALLAARRERIPTLLHEQNAVLGRVNRLMAGRVDAIATSYDNVQRLPGKAADKVHLVGNPVRDEVLALRDQPFPPLTEDGIFRMLVTGGSQGASILSEVVPEGLALLPSISGGGSRSRSNAGPRISSRCARAMPRSALPPISPPICPICPNGSPGRTSSSPAPAPRPSPSSPPPAGRRSWCPLAQRHRRPPDLQRPRHGQGRRRRGRFPSRNSPRSSSPSRCRSSALEPAALATAAGRARGAGMPDAAQRLADLVERTGCDPGADPLFVRDNVLRPMTVEGALA
jgi:UDP-N-acetylglucosamine--N-acetylmuramyl-(pentapeptide) pyrophosphoryl-undecaprenol N-acetylglucosamine transferase